ncbi:hypothetical protein RFI_40083, partial [Reticulomyxa filosa]
VFDYEHRTIMLFNEKKLKIKSLQVGNPKNSSLEFNVYIQFLMILTMYMTHTKWTCLIINHTRHFRTIKCDDRNSLSNFVSVNESKNVNAFEFNSFHVIWKDSYKKIFKEPLNPYSVTFKHGIRHFKDKLQVRDRFVHGSDEPIYFKCKTELSSKISNENNMYSWYPTNAQLILKEIIYQKVFQFKIFIRHQKTKFNSLLYESELHKLKHIQGIVNVKVTRNKQL